MPAYVVKPSAAFSKNDTHFPLLTGMDSYLASDGQLFPRSITFSTGERSPLFSGGIVPTAEVEEIAYGIGQSIVKKFAGSRILIIQILDGAVPFCKMVLKKLHMRDDLSCELASIKVSSYTNGTKSFKHKVSLPLQNQQGEYVEDLSEYDGVVIIDDLIDAGNTFAWLIGEYLANAGGKELTGYFMLDKQRKRSKEAQALLDLHNPLCGQQVPDEWVVGLGLDIALPGTETLPSLHLFRNALPGGIYAFNSSIEQKLIKEYHAEPERLREQLGVYIS